MKSWITNALASRRYCGVCDSKHKEAIDNLCAEVDAANVKIPMAAIFRRLCETSKFSHTYVTFTRHMKDCLGRGK